MSTITEITSLAEIRERKAEVRRELDRTKKAAANQLANTAGEAKTYVLRDVILPAAGVALSVYLLTRVVKSVTSSSSPEHREEYVTNSYQEGDHSGPSAATAPMQTTAPRRRAAPRTKPAAKKRAPFQPASLINLGQLLIPAGKAILNIIKENSK